MSGVNAAVECKKVLFQNVKYIFPDGFEAGSCREVEDIDGLSFARPWPGIWCGGFNNRDDIKSV